MSEEYKTKILNSLPEFMRAAAFFPEFHTPFQSIVAVEDGVTVVNNPKDPIYKNNVFFIEEELSIERKSAEPEEEMFQNIVSLVIDDAGNIYILDKKAANIKIFNKDGNFLKIIGQ